MDDSKRRLAVGGVLVATLVVAAVLVALLADSRTPATVEDSKPQAGATSLISAPAPELPPAPIEAAPSTAAPVPISTAPLVVPSWVPTGQLRGRFVTARGEPVRGVAVGLSEDPPDESADPFDLPSFATASSEADGRFVFRFVPAGFSVSLAGSLPDGRLVSLPKLAVPTDGELDLGDILVTDAARLQGLVTDENGEFIAGATVVAGADSVGYLVGSYGGCDDLNIPGLRETRTGADGVFALDGLPPRTVTVMALAPGHARSMSTLRLLPAAPNIVELELPAEQILAGRVVSSDGEAAPGVHVLVMSPEARGLARCATTGAQGEFSVDQLPPGRYKLDAYASRDREAHTLADAGDRNVLLTLSLGNDFVFHLAVEDARGHPARGFSLWCAAMETHSARTPLMPGEQAGVYSLGSTQGSEMSIDGFDGSYFSFWAQTASETSAPERLASDSHSLTLRLEPAVPLQGTVIDAESGTPLAGAEVCVRAGIGGSMLPDGALWTDEKGRFTLPNPPLCALAIWARAANHLANKVSASLDQRGSVVVPLKATGGVMLRPDPALHGQTFESRVVILRQREGSSQQTAVFNGRPQFLTDLAPGSYDVLAFRASSTADGATAVEQVLESIDVRGGQVSEVVLHLPPGAPAGG